MSRILSFTTGPDDWKALLADPEKQWRVGYSARTLATCWEAAEGCRQARHLDHVSASRADQGAGYASA
jgi:hypothetical protein